MNEYTVFFEIVEIESYVRLRQFISLYCRDLKQATIFCYCKPNLKSKLATTHETVMHAFNEQCNVVPLGYRFYGSVHSCVTELRTTDNMIMEVFEHVEYTGCRSSSAKKLYVFSGHEKGCFRDFLLLYNHEKKVFGSLTVDWIPHDSTLHDSLGCNADCLKHCNACNVQYKTCDEARAKCHEQDCRSGYCRREGCNRVIKQCQIQRDKAHVKTHQRCGMCQNLLKQCPIWCSVCSTKHCPQSNCMLSSQALDECQICSKTFIQNKNPEQSLIAHFQSCACNSPLYSKRFKCRCGVYIVNHEHECSHKEKGSKKICGGRDIFKYNEFLTLPTLGYSVGNYYSVDETIKPGLVEDIRKALEQTNSALLTVSTAELTEDVIKKFQKAREFSINKCQRFGSLVKNTAIPGMVDVDLLVTIN